MDFGMDIQYSQLKMNHLNNTPSTKADRGGIFSGVFQKGRQGTSQGQEDFELSWYLFFQQPRELAQNAETWQGQKYQKNHTLICVAMGLVQSPPPGAHLQDFWWEKKSLFLVPTEPLNPP
jgi:hypothetical protein